MKKPNHNEIVSRVELRLYRHIVDTAICLDGCKCEKCFQKFLDGVVSRSNEVTPLLHVEAIQIEHFVG